jgi:DNA polymerase-4
VLLGPRQARRLRRHGPRGGLHPVRARAEFHDDSPVETETGVAKSVSTERTFDSDIASHAELETVLRALARELCEGLQSKGRRGRTVAIKVRLADWTTVTRARTLADATNDTSLVTDTAVALLHAYAPPQPVRLLGVRLAAFDDLEPDRPPPPVTPVGQLALPV